MKRLSLVEKEQAELFARTHNVKILSTRWVAVDKRDGETKEQIVRARIVVRDYASGGPTAKELGISSPTSSNEVFRTFLIFVSSHGGDIVLAVVSTAFLFAEVVSPEVVMLRPTSGTLTTAGSTWSSERPCTDLGQRRWLGIACLLTWLSRLA